MCPRPKSGKKTHAAITVKMIIAARLSAIEKEVFENKKNATTKPTIIIANAIIYAIAFITLPRFL